MPKNATQRKLAPILAEIKALDAEISQSRKARAAAVKTLEDPQAEEKRLRDSIEGLAAKYQLATVEHPEQETPALFDELDAKPRQLAGLERRVQTIRDSGLKAADAKLTNLCNRRAPLMKDAWGVVADEILDQIQPEMAKLFHQLAACLGGNSSQHAVTWVRQHDITPQARESLREDLRSRYGLPAQSI